MGIEKLFMTAVKKDKPLDGSAPAGNSLDKDGKPKAATEGEVVAVSDFLTIQSLTNFAAMTGAISAAWSALIVLNADWFQNKTVPFIFVVVFGIVSMLISPDALKKEGSFDFGRVAATLFIGFINSLVLFSAVIGMNNVTSEAQGKPPQETTINQLITKPYS